MITWTEHLGASDRITLAITDRDGGCSVGPYSGAGGGLNLAAHVGDDPAAVRQNRRRLAGAIGLPEERLVVADQVHGTRVVQVTGPMLSPPSADALVTTTADLALMVLVADCVPVMLAAPDEGVVAVAHAGREGMASGVIAAVVGAMRDLGAGTLVARLGPSICARCYGVPAELRERVGAVAPFSGSTTWDGRPSIDVSGAVLAQLASLGVSARQLPGCTAESASLYSYRRDGTTGRFAGLAWIDGVGTEE